MYQVTLRKDISARPPFSEQSKRGERARERMEESMSGGLVTGGEHATADGYWALNAERSAPRGAPFPRSKPSRRDVVMFSCWGFTILVLLSLLIAVGYLATMINKAVTYADDIYHSTRDAAISESLMKQVDQFGLKGPAAALLSPMIYSAQNYGVGQMLAEVIAEYDPRGALGALHDLLAKIEASFPDNSAKGYAQANVEQVESVVHFYAAFLRQVVEPWRGIGWPTRKDKPKTAPGLLTQALLETVEKQLEAAPWAQLGQTCVDAVAAIEALDLKWDFKIHGPGIEADRYVPGPSVDVGEDIFNVTGFGFLGVDTCKLTSAKTSDAPAWYHCASKDGHDVEQGIEDFINNVGKASWPFTLDDVKTICMHIAQL